MPRRPRIHRQRLKTLPIGFSPFARALARMDSLSTAKCQTRESEFIEKPNPSSASNGFAEQTSDDEAEQSASSSDEQFDGVVQADFSFFDPKPDDFHGVKTLLQTYLDDKEWDLSGFVDLILEQTTVGTVVKIEDDEDEGLFACVSALNLWRYREQKCIMEVKDYLHKACQDKGVVDKLRLLLEEQACDVGLLVSQRVVNLPPQLLPPLYDGLFDEVSWATEDEPTEDLRKSFQFKHYIILSKIYKHKNAEQKRKLSDDSEAEMIYIKPEDEIFHKLSSWSFIFPLRPQQPAPHELKNYRPMGLVMAVEADKIPSFRQELVTLISET
ncbi:PREDICTED: protein BCCIP homolog [Lupinus angustifolius]|uniref:protein BCCIP homolog n=1 Tax=Lupinus angustifolius TaxID=3871 RepID=UPI00092E5FA9|nr:PREDICTED: protein BCCIP homolog [Lupinus angustifolius]XP_019462560.1 PREDICTED: protein BCCIP homolog [Lupinus angustifolius]